MEVVVPVLTPFNKEGSIDKDLLKSHVQNLLDKGVDAIFVNGSTGLGPSLSKDEKKLTLSTVAGVTNKVIFQVGELNLNNVLELVKFSSDYDIMAIASYSPFYFTRLPEKWLANYFSSIISASKHPVYLYNYPLATGYDISAKVVSKYNLDFAGVKDTNQDLSHTLEFKSTFPKMKVFNGSDTLAFYSLLTLDGTVASMANPIPAVFSKMKEYVKNGDLRSALSLQRVIISLVEISRKYGHLASLYVMTETVQGYSVGYPRPPIFPLDDSESKALKGEIESFVKGLMPR
ncbi:2-dehydro-3-deoxyphosphogluconate aldolase [Metallosphaera tengchongensis]|uniref:2-dehydro-3-deoxyphosphogluconate aldolase n=1 Tax=Metallosphaera tengchongensis TaxID=1532350 RepID=A0A6N0NQR7_9CREN|nr:bifunctional 2-dehydro-3-deoxy-phosphogluconate/2-dehydro-3-deoxy-6-phosphogalactonate aldolase [Metallosphaera tengchongensis]QKQ99065.1 2-dehydro-3-deoxyphosphogluconate aldolase [Metallosphaera tengchongensis]